MSLKALSVQLVTEEGNHNSLVFKKNLLANAFVNSCNFIKTKETLKTGYCRGGNCFLEDIPHPDLDSFISM